MAQPSVYVRKHMTVESTWQANALLTVSPNYGSRVGPITNTQNGKYETGRQIDLQPVQVSRSRFHVLKRLDFRPCIAAILCIGYGRAGYSGWGYCLILVLLLVVDY